MPIHCHSMTRRELLARSVAAGAALVLGPAAFGADRDAKADADCFALLSDTHVAADAAKVARGVNMTEHLTHAFKEITSLKARPAGAIISGDCVYLKGLKEDYQQFARVIGPVREAELPLHLAMGNHDDRDNMYAVLSEHKPARPLVEGKHVSIVSSPHANWFLLDSLNIVNTVAGKLGAEQLAWLAKALDAHADKPAIVVAHHDLPMWEVAGQPKPSKVRISGLLDTPALLDVLAKRRHVKAYVYGHTHRWGHITFKDIHLINLPAVAYVFKKTEPSGWTLAQLGPKGITLTLHCLDPKHKANGEKLELTWRT